MTLSNNIKQKMKEKKFSVHSLEKRAGLKQSAIQNILYGRSRNPSVTLIRTIAQALDCTIEELIGTRDVTRSATDSLLFDQKSDISGKKWKWNQKLYLNCFKIFYDLASKENVGGNKSDIIGIIDEIYNYSCENKIEYPDELFANWLIKRAIERNGHKIL